MTLWIDRRWSGQHGIGRYAAEVYSRLSVRGEILQVSSPTAAGLSAFASVPKGLIYSPATVRSFAQSVRSSRSTTSFIFRHPGLGVRSTPPTTMRSHVLSSAARALF